MKLFETHLGERQVYGGAAIPTSRLPDYAVNQNDPNDQVFTKPDVAARCFSVFQRVAAQNGYDLGEHTFLEPAAGSGSFSNLFPTDRCLALDIAPKADNIQQADFLSWSPPRGRYAVVGNPPFGKRGATALAFVNRCAVFADIVGFILPMTFASNGKGGAMTRVRRLRLLHSEELPSGSFYLDEVGDKDIGTVFQVWGSRDLEAASPLPSCDQFVDVFTISTIAGRRCGTHRVNDCDLFIQSTFYENKPPKVVKNFGDVKYGAGYGIIIKQRNDEIEPLLSGVDWLDYSSRATNNCRHIRIRHIQTALIEAGFHGQ